MLIRPDRLGDFLLSTPSFSRARELFPDAHIAVVARPWARPLVKGHPSVDDFLEFDPGGRHSGWKGFFRLVKDLREFSADLAVVLQSHPRLSWALGWARVPVRVGPLSRPHTRWVLNRGLRQRRSQVKGHEAEYNLELVHHAAGLATSIFPPPQAPSTWVRISSESRRQAQAWLEECGPSGSGPLIAVHPGMGGSALNWPQEHYTELVRELVKSGFRVVVTGAAFERDLVEQVVFNSGATAFLGMADGQPTDISFLGGLFAQCDLVVAPSTGPLHLAVALERPVVSFYPTIRVQSPKRWGPFQAMKASVLTPEGDQGMETLSVSRALGEVEKLLQFKIQ